MRIIELYVCHTIRPYCDVGQVTSVRPIGIIQSVFPALWIEVRPCRFKRLTWLLGLSLAQRILMDVNCMLARRKILEAKLDHKAPLVVVEDRGAYALALHILQLDSLFRKCSRCQLHIRDHQSG